MPVDPEHAHQQPASRRIVLHHQKMHAGTVSALPEKRLGRACATLRWTTGPMDGPPHSRGTGSLLSRQRRGRFAQAAQRSFFLYQSTFTDKTLECADCGQQFNHSAQDQQFYAERQFSEPRRCPTCRAVRKAARGDSAAAATAAVVAAAIPRAATASARCSPPPATAAVARPACRSGPPAPSRSTAATASAPAARPMRPTGRL